MERSDNGENSRGKNIPEHNKDHFYCGNNIADMQEEDLVN